MAQTTSGLLFLAILVRRSACLSWAVEPSDTESSASQTYVSSASLGFIPVTPGKGVSRSTLPTLFPGASSVSAIGSGQNDAGGQGSVSSILSNTVGRPSPPEGTGLGSTELVLTGTQTFSASSAIFIATTQTSASASNSVIDPPPDPSTSSGAVSLPAIPPLPASPTASTTSQSAPQIVQLPTTPLTSSQLPTSTFGNAVHVSETLSPSTSIFTTTSYSLFTTDGHVTSTAIPILSTSVTLVPVPTHTSAQTASKSSSSGPSTSVAVGIALGGVAVFLVLVLFYIINRRRNLRQRAVLRLGEEI